MRLDFRVGFHYRFFGAFFCARAEPAADLEGELVRPSRRVLDAAEAAGDEVTFFGTTCDKALPAADFEDFPVAMLERTLDAAFAA